MRWCRSHTQKRGDLNDAYWLCGVVGFSAEHRNAHNVFVHGTGRGPVLCCAVCMLCSSLFVKGKNTQCYRSMSFCYVL
jgi:hypothetical protein